MLRRHVAGTDPMHRDRGGVDSTRDAARWDQVTRGTCYLSNVGNPSIILKNPKYIYICVCVCVRVRDGSSWLPYPPIYGGFGDGLLGL